MFKGKGKADEIVAYQLLLPLTFKLAIVGGFNGLLQKVCTVLPDGIGTKPTLTKTDNLDVSQPVFGLV